MAQDKERRGFASMDKAKQRAIASKGGKAAQKRGTGHKFASGEQAREAGRKGGLARRRNLDALGGQSEVESVVADDLSRFSDEGNPHG